MHMLEIWKLPTLLVIFSNIFSGTVKLNLKQTTTNQQFYSYFIFSKVDFFPSVNIYNVYF